MALSEAELTFVRDLVRRRSGIVLEASKQYLVESRLGPLARDAGFASVDALVAWMRLHDDEATRTNVVEALATNETTFFRDQHPFDALREHVVPELVRARAATRTLNVWSAACSTGQEPYSIAMALQEIPELRGWKIHILATDLCASTLERAREGVYRQIDVSRGLPPHYLSTRFAKEGLSWRICRELRDAVTFRAMNLIEAWPSLPTFDIVFLRNVLIYFDATTRVGVLGRTHATMARDGYLFLGAAESGTASGCPFASARLGNAIVHRPRNDMSGAFPRTEPGSGTTAAPFGRVGGGSR